MRLLAVLLAACLFLSCNPKPVPERQSYKRDDGITDGQGGKISRDFNVVDDMLSSLDQCFHILEQAVNECGGAGGNEPTSKSQELSDERDDSDERRKGKEPQTEPPTTPPTTPPKAYTGPAVIIVHNQEEGLEKTADQQGIGNRDRGPSRASEEPPSSPEVIVHIDRGGNPESNDESAGSQALRKDDSTPSDQDDGEEEEEEEEKSPPTASVVVVHIDRGEDGSDSADASSQSVGKGKNKGREKSRGGEDEDDEKPTPDVIVIHINRKEDTGQEVEDATSLAVEQSRRKPNEPPTEPTTALPTTEGPPPKVIIIHTDREEGGNEEAEAEGLRRPETTNPPTNPPTEPPTHRNVPPTDVIIIHRDQPSTAEIESDIEYAMQYWLNRGASEPPTESTQAPPTTSPRGPVRVIIVPDAREESVDEIVSQVTAYSVGGRFRSRNNNEEEKSTETPPTETPVGRDGSPLIIVIDRRPIAVPTTSTNTQTEPPPDDSLALKTIELATKKLKADALKPVSSQAKEKFEMELERGGMFMSPSAQESSREKENKTEHDSADGRDSDSSRRNKTTDATDLPTEEPSATIETDTSGSPTRDDSATSTTEEPSTTEHSQSDSTADTEEPSESTTDRPTDSEATDVSTHSTDSDTATHSPDTTTDTEPAAEAGEWPMESVFYEQSARSSSAKSKKADVMDKALEDYLHFRRKRQGGSSYQFTPQDCLQLFSSIIETHYADKLKFLDDK